MNGNVSGQTSFGTEWGEFSIEWTGKGIKGVGFPRPGSHCEPGRCGPPAFVREAMRRIGNHVGGRIADFTDLPLDLSGLGEFSRAVLTAARGIPAGKTATYGELAARVGRPGAARAVGQAMARNPVPLVVPCHRVLAAGRRLRGFSAYGGTDTKRRLLELESAGPVRD